MRIFFVQKAKKVAKKRVPEMSLLRASRSFFQDPLQILLTKHRMYLRLKPAQMPFGKSPPNLGQTNTHTQTNKHTKSIRSVALDLGSPLRGQKLQYTKGTPWYIFFGDPPDWYMKTVILKQPAPVHFSSIRYIRHIYDIFSYFPRPDRSPKLKSMYLHEFLIFFQNSGCAGKLL